VNINATTSIKVDSSLWPAITLAAQPITPTLTQSSYKVGQSNTVYTFDFNLLGDVPEDLSLTLSFTQDAVGGITFLVNTASLSIYGTSATLRNLLGFQFQNPHTTYQSTGNLSLAISYFKNLNYLGTSSNPFTIQLRTSNYVFAVLTGAVPSTTQPGTLTITNIQASPAQISSSSTLSFFLDDLFIQSGMYLTILLPTGFSV
jgi:hypothetical protein